MNREEAGRAVSDADREHDYRVRKGREVCLKRVVPIGFGIALSVFVIVTIFSYMNMARLITVGKTRTRVYDTVERLESLLTYSNAAESGKNEYIITGDTGSLEAYYDGIDIIEKEIQDLRRVMADNVRQQRRFDTLEPLIEQRFANLREAIGYQQKRGFNSAVQGRLSEEGKKLQESVRTVVTHMIREEKALLRRLEVQMEAAGRGAFAAMTLGTLMSFLILYRVFYLLDREMAERQRAESALRESEERLALIISKSPDMVFQQDRELRYVWITNLPPPFLEGEVLGKTDFDLFPPEEAEPLVKYKRKVLETGSGLRFEMEVTYGGAVHCFDEAVEPWQDREGHVAGITGYARDITEKKRTEEALKKSEQRLSMMVENLPAGALHREGNSVFFNKAVEELTGHTRSEIVTLDQWFAALYGPQADVVRGYYEEDRAAGFPSTRTVPVTRKDGRTRYVEFAAYQYGEEREVWLLHDVTESKRAADALRQNEQLLRKILETIPVGVWVTDEEGTLLIENPAGRQIWCDRRAEGEGATGEYKGWWADTGKMIEPGEWALARLLLTGRPSLNEVIDIECLDGTRKTVLSSAVPIRDEEGKLVYAIVVNQDITERKRTERELERLSRTYELILKSAGEGIFGMDREGKYTFVNHAAADMLGYTEEELVGRSMHTLIHHTRADGSSYPEEECLIFKGLREGTVQRSDDEVFWRKDGTSFPVEYISTPIIEKGAVVGAVVTFREITERKRSEESLSKYIRELEQRNREIEMLSGMASMLQACVTVEEVYTVIGTSLQKLFSGEAGVVYLFSSSRDIFEPVVFWGEERLPGEPLEAKECWALRLGRAYTVDSSHEGMSCLHVANVLPAGYLCVPLAAQGETMGLLHMRFGAHWLYSPEEARERRRSMERLVEAVAESIALSLANFKLRESLYLQSTHDPLTGLCNRRSMDELLEKELHRMARKGQTLGLIMLDIDHFKPFNDTYGHKAGDMLLRELGSFLRRNIREEDYACRYGGEEFVIILPETTPEKGRYRAEQIRERIKEIRLHYEGQVLPAVTLSLGVSFFPLNGSTIDELLRAADVALYHAKSEGRDRVATA
ncbi:MAG: PAS domain S-box protein [Alphaproteobacteria bacterium]|uniref:PAS domain S-box protein n=1 Tax=Candidatus Nitrobium versatile TaxID=2884831 RepID=A0A953LWJ1_9BACT|nr:PAS domain S-box protein [Candidatus Nitrobium versatile]